MIAGYDVVRFQKPGGLVVEGFVHQLLRWEPHDTRPGEWWVYWTCGFAHLVKGDPKEALRSLQPIASISFPPEESKELPF